MGLDMYLTASKHIGGYEHNEEPERALFNDILATIGLAGWKSEAPSLHIEINVAYWRKANAIHGWFVREVQDGEDECEKHCVSQEQLTTLRDLCKRLLVNKNAEEAQSELPPQGGFFFGNAQLNDWYWMDLENTVNQLDAVLGNKALEGMEFYYQSSW